MPTTFTQGLLTSTSPWNDTGNFWATYNAAIGAMFEPVFAIVADQGNDGEVGFVPGWSSLLDPVNCPTQFLPYLGMFVGANLPPGRDPTTARSEIQNENAQNRGTVASIIGAVQRNLIGAKSAIVLERTAANGSADAYHFIVVVKPGEVGTVLGITNAVNNVKPGGLQWTLVITDGWLISQMELSQATIAALEANFSTLSRLENNQPG